LKISFACWDYDRILPLVNGRVKIDNIELAYTPLWVQETFSRMLRSQEFDVAEMSLGAYVGSLSQKNPPFVAIPIFPSRMFRHGSIFVNSHSEIKYPRDIIGKKVGLPEYRQTATVWMRGILSEKFNVPVTSVQYFVGRLESKVNGKYFYDLSNTEILPRRSDINIVRISQGSSLSAMLEKGEIDVLYSALPPSCFLSGYPHVDRLFPNYRDVEEAYFRETSIFPIMHVIVIRRELYESNKWLAMSLYKGFEEAKDLVFDDVYKKTGGAHVKSMLPWFTSEMERTIQIMGVNYWPYGLKNNLKTLETFLKYFLDQGLSEKLLAPSEMFAQELLST
jgi:4,5-dihydroxyphthalate decarboxylase